MPFRQHLSPYEVVFCLPLGCKHLIFPAITLVIFRSFAYVFSLVMALGAVKLDIFLCLAGGWVALIFFIPRLYSFLAG